VGTPSLSGGGTSTSGTGGTPSAGSGAPVPGAGIIGVVSKSKATSIKIYNGRTRYDQWAVTWQDVRPGKGLPPDLLQAIGAGAAGAAGAFGQPGSAAPPPGANPFAPVGSAPIGAPGTPIPFGTPGASPFGGSASPFGGGQPMAAPPGGLQPAPQTPFTPAYPPPPAGGAGGTPFGPPPKKQ
jgi:hypothetical protein